MSVTLTREQREALEKQPEQPLLVEDPLTRDSYVLMTSSQFQRLVYDDSDLSPDEMIAAAVAAADAADGK